MVKSSKGISLFDIRVKGTDHDVLVVRGVPEEAPSVLLSGSIVLSVTEPINVKKISLKLYGMIRIKVTTVYQGARGPAMRNLRYDKKIYEHNWDNIDISPYLVDTRSLSRSSSSSSLGAGLSRMGRSTTSLKNLAVGPAHHNTLLPEGNYEFAFTSIIPGSLVESVEGLPNASVTYKLQATLDKGKFSNDVVIKKHLRVVRTLATDAVELFETVSVDNTWPDKVDYSISIPTKAIAIGSSTPIHLLIVPLLKGLKLGPIKISLVEYSNYCAPYGNPNGAERTVVKVKLRDPLNHLKNVNADGTDIENEQNSLFQDKWELSTVIRVPPNLSKCTQDCMILNNLKVRHKLKFVIALVNPDGHVSELRASLPVQLFISPFVTVAVKHALETTNSNTTSGSNSENEDNEAEDYLFANSNSEINLAGLDQARTMDPGASTGPVLAPPNYANHVYDRLWNSISVEDTPMNSGTQSPVDSNQQPILSNQQNLNDLERSLRELHMEREMNDIEGTGLSYENNIPSRSALATPLSLADVPSQLRLSDYFLPTNSQNNNSMPHLPNNLKTSLQMNSPGYDYLSRANSCDFRVGSPSKNDWEISSLSRVPSYDNAMKADSVVDDLPPAYPNDEGDQNSPMFGPERPKQLHLRGVSDYGSATSPTFSKLSNGNLERSRNRSFTSVPKFFLDDNKSEIKELPTNKLLTRPTINKSTSTSALKCSTTKQSGLSMTPLGSVYRSATPPAGSTAHSNSRTSKGGTLSGVVSMFQKKDRN